MAHKLLAVASSFIVAAWPISASSQPMPPMGAPAAPPGAKYCMKVEAPTGSRIEPIECWTREEWAYEGVDVDHDWAKEGVAVLA